VIDAERPARRHWTGSGSGIQPVGDGPGGHGGNGPLCGVRPRLVEGHDPVTDRAVLDAGADRNDCARGEVAHDVRDRRRSRSGAGKQVPALDADRLSAARGEELAEQRSALPGEQAARDDGTMV
jgi:hypothetical protein